MTDRRTPVPLGYATPQPRRSVEELLTDFVLHDRADPAADRRRLLALIVLVGAAIAGTVLLLIA